MKIPNVQPTRTIDNAGTIRYHLNGVRHRIGGPAVIWADGTEFWYYHGGQHREDGPAVIWTDGTKEYWLDGKFISKRPPNITEGIKMDLPDLPESHERQGGSMKLKKLKGLLSLKAAIKNSDIVMVVLTMNLAVPILIILLIDFIQFKISWTDIRVIISLIFIGFLVTGITNYVYGKGEEYD